MSVCRSASRRRTSVLCTALMEMSGNSLSPFTTHSISASRSPLCSLNLRMDYVAAACESYSHAAEELRQRRGLAWRVRELVEEGVQPRRLFVAHVRLDAVADHVHAPLEAVVLDIPMGKRGKYAHSQSRKNFSVTRVRASSCSCTSFFSSPASGNSVPLK